MTARLVGARELARFRRALKAAVGREDWAEAAALAEARLAQQSESAEAHYVLALAEVYRDDLAAAVGTSHRMLIYHFGSRVGLVTAIVEEVEARQRALMRELAAASPHADSADMVRAVWTQVTSPDVLPFVQLFFEAVAYAARA